MAAPLLPAPTTLAVLDGVPIDPALAATIAALAVAAALVRAVTWDGALAGVVVAGAAGAAFGWAGVGVLGGFVGGGTLATRFGYARKEERGTAEARGGARDARRVVGKGVVATLVALATVAIAAGGDPGGALGRVLAGAFAGALAAALADTLGTEIGSLAGGAPRLLPAFSRVPPGTPGAVSLQGTLAGAGGGLLIGALSAATGLLALPAAAGVALSGPLASAIESVATALIGAVAHAPGWVRNLVSTGSGALLGGAAGWALS